MLRVTTDIDTNPGNGVSSQILVNSVIRDRWGLNWMKLPPTSYSIRFTDVQGFTTPPNMSATIVNGLTTSRNAVFEPFGAEHDARHHCTRYNGSDHDHDHGRSVDTGRGLAVGITRLRRVFGRLALQRRAKYRQRWRLRYCRVIGDC